MTEAPVLRVARIIHPTLNLGPGVRIAIWLQGCSLGCRGCVSKSLWRKDGGRSIDVRTLTALCLDLADGYRGITISGGEPFEQYPALMAFCALLKATSSLDIWVFSGFELAELAAAYPDRAFMRYIDYLVDGRYVESRASGDALRGSDNQRMYRFADGTSHPWTCEGTSDERIWSLSVPSSQRVYLTGIPAPGDLDHLARALVECGREIRFR